MRARAYLRVFDDLLLDHVDAEPNLWMLRGPVIMKIGIGNAIHLFDKYGEAYRHVWQHS